MAATVQCLDEILKEYLLFRGFTSTLKAFDTELKSDKDKSFRVNKIVEQLISFVVLYDLQGIRDYWNYLKKRFFSRLDSAHHINAQKLEKCLYRFYLVNAVQATRPDRVMDFFEKMAPELQNQMDWKEWFALPFLKTPEQNPNLEMYFSQLWQETFPLSLHNFLNAIFQSMPLPRLLKFNAERIICENLRQDNNHLQQKNTKLQQEISILQGDKEKKVVSKDSAFQSRVEKPKVTKTKEKETNFMQRRFWGKTQKEPKVLSLPDQETQQQSVKQTEPTDEQPFEETNSVLHENKDFDQIPQVQASNPEPVKPAENAEKISKEDELENELLNLSDNYQAPNEKTLTITKNHYDNFDDPNLKVQRSLSVSAKESPRTTTPRRNTSTSGYREMVSMTNYSGDFPRKDGATKPFLILSEDIFVEHRSPIVQCDFSPSGNLVASVDSDGIVKVWKHRPLLSTVATVMSKSPLLCIEWASKSDKMLLLGTSNGKIRLYDTEAKTTRCDVSTDSQFTRVVSLASSPFGTSFVCSATAENKLSMSSVFKHAQEKNTEATQLGTLLLWDLKSMKLERHLPLGISATRINCIAYNHNGTLLVTGGADGTIRMYDTRSYDCLMHWAAHSGQVNSVQFSVDETSVFSMGRDNQFLQWSLRKMGLKTATLATHEGMSGPRDNVLSGRMKHGVFSRLFTFDCKGDHLLTCSPTSGVIYKYNKSDNSLSHIISIGEQKFHVTSVDWSTAVNFITCLTGSLNGPIRLTTLLKNETSSESPPLF